MAGRILNARIDGDGQPLVLLHGLFGALDNLGGIRRRLQDDYRVVSLDVRNHGDSPWGTAMAYPELAEDVWSTLDQLGLEQTHVLGHSMGGKIAMQMALDRPERIQGLVVGDIAPVAYDPHHQSILTGLSELDPEDCASRREADERLSRWVEEPRVRQFLLTNLVPREEGGYRWRLNLEGIIAGYDSILSAPENSREEPYSGAALFIRGGDSDYIQSAHRDAFEALFPQASVKVIPETGHWLHAEKPDLFAGICRRFLERWQD